MSFKVGFGWRDQGRPKTKSGACYKTTTAVADNETTPLPNPTSTLESGSRIEWNNANLTCPNLFRFPNDGNRIAQCTTCFVAWFRRHSYLSKNWRQWKKVFCVPYDRGSSGHRRVEHSSPFQGYNRDRVALVTRIRYSNIPSFLTTTLSCLWHRRSKILHLGVSLTTPRTSHNHVYTVSHLVQPAVEHYRWRFLVDTTLSYKWNWMVKLYNVMDVWCRDHQIQSVSK